MLTTLRNRRSIRKFQPTPVEPEKIDALCEALLRSPTSRNLRPWEFIIVEDRATLDRLAHAKSHGTSFFGTATLGIVIAADPATCDVWIEDCSIAAIIVQLTAESLGLKSCWAQLRERPNEEAGTASEYVRRLLDIPQNLEVPIAIAVGYPAEEKEGHARESLPFSKIHRGRFK